MHSSVSSTTGPLLSPQRSLKFNTGLPNAPVSEPKTAPRTPSSPSQAAFICTICWQHHPPGAKPKLLGSSARIVCVACWRAVLDLSICWVCGECIVRGDEVVSLGWCFWHKGCFGCLICRTRMSVPRLGTGEVCNRTAEWGRWNGSGDNESGRRRGVSIELNSIPLCNICSVETAAESQDQVLERGLECITEFDGGLSRDRLDMLTELADEREGEITLTRRLSARTSRRLRGATGIEQDLKRYINGSSGRFKDDLVKPEDGSSLLENVADIGMMPDGAMDGKKRHMGRSTASSEGLQEIEQSDVYVSVLDPVGEPAFKPSKFKPLPSWMSLLPNNVHKRRGQKIDSFLKRNSQLQSKADACVEDSDSDSIESLGDSHGSPIALVDMPNLRGGGRTKLSVSSPEKSRQQWERRAVSFKPSYIAEDNGNHQCPRALEAASDAVYSVPSEYDPFHYRLPRRRTPYPQDFPCLSTLRKDANASARQHRGSDIAEETANESCCELGLELLQRPDSDEDQLFPARREAKIFWERLTPSLSTPAENLDKNQLRSHGPEKNHHTAGKGEPKLGRRRREKAREQNRAKSTRNRRNNEITNGAMGLRVAGERQGVESRREQLKRELKSLLREE